FIRSFLRWAYKSGHSPTDLSRWLVIPKLPDPLPRDIPSLKEIADIIRAQRTNGDSLALRNAAIISLLFACGLRRKELCDLKLQDIDLAEREVRVARGKGGRG